MTTATQPESPSTLEVIFGSKQGRMVLLMGAVYTLIVSLSIGMFYVLTTWQITLGLAAVYATLTTVLVYFRAPMQRLVLPAFLVFTVIPVVMGAVTILIIQLLV